MNQIPPMQLALQHMQKKDFLSAKTILQTEWHKNNDEKVLRLLIVAALESSDFQLAEDSLAQLYKINYADPSYYFLKGILHEKQDQKQDAIENYKISFYLDQKNLQAYNKIYQLLKDTNQLEKYTRTADHVFCTGGYFFKKKFNPTTLENEGLGGSESAFVYITKELAKLGQKILAFCNCDAPGNYDGVEFFFIHDFPFMHRLNQFPHVISSRFLDPFYIECGSKAKHSLWLHDSPEASFYSHINWKDVRVDEFFVLSEYHKNLWQQALPKEWQPNLFQTSNGFDEKLFFPKEERKKQMIFTSRPERGLKEAFKVWANLKNKGHDLEFVACTYTQELDLKNDPDLADCFDLFNHPGVHFKGALSKQDLALEIQNSKILIHPNVITNIETSCIAAIEAQACGVPVICGEGGALKETVQNNTSGIVISYNNKEDLISKLTDAIDLLLNNDDLWKKLSEGAANWAKAHYKWSTVAKNWLNHWKNS